MDSVFLSEYLIVVLPLTSSWALIVTVYHLPSASQWAWNLTPTSTTSSSVPPLAIGAGEAEAPGGG